MGQLEVAAGFMIDEHLSTGGTRTRVNSQDHGFAGIGESPTGCAYYEKKYLFDAGAAARG